MTILKPRDINLDFEEFAGAQGDALGRPGMRDIARKALERSAELVSPAVSYDWFEVGARDGLKAEVGGVILSLGRHADLLAPARVAFVAVVTIGPRLEEQARELRASTRALDAFMLDAAGIFAVGKMIELARSIVEKDAVERGWGVGAELAPGQLAGWSIAEQKLVAGLLDVESIGVSVTDSGMLVPQKSASDDGRRWARVRIHDGSVALRVLRSARNLPLQPLAGSRGLKSRLCVPDLSRPRPPEAEGRSGSSRCKPGFPATDARAGGLSISSHPLRRAASRSFIARGLDNSTL